MNITLIRHAFLPDCTLGRLHVNDMILATIERPWIPNPSGAGGRPRESCIPDGYYNLRAHDSPAHPDTYILLNAALGVYGASLPAGQDFGRSAILIHPANWARELMGCIAPGAAHQCVSGVWQVLRSREAMDRLRATLGREEHYIEIRPTAGTQELP